MSKDEFMNLVLDGISSPPQYFEHDVAMNKNGYTAVFKLVGGKVSKDRTALTVLT